MKTLKKSNLKRKYKGKSVKTKVKTKSFMNSLGIKNVKKGNKGSKLLSIKKLPDTKTHVERHEIVSASSGNLYIVSKIKSTGLERCNCMGHVRYGHCKHAKAVFG